MQEYDFRPVGTGDAELETIAGLFRLVWPQARHLTSAYLRWLYAANPSGPVIGFNAWSGDTLAGHYVVIPVRVLFHGEPVKAALSLNTAVHPDHQGRGLFTKLAEQTYDLAKTRAVHHVVGVANANSTPGFVRKLSFQLVQPLDVYVLWRWPTLRSTLESLSTSWSRIWEPSDLSWRLRNPSVRYSVRTRRRCRQILSPTGTCGVSALLKLDVASEAAPIDDVPLSAAPCLGLRLWMGLSSRIVFPTLGGMRLPERFRKSPLNLIVRYLEPGSTPIDAGTVEFQAIDFDAY